ncbi:hypothetical protein SAMN05428934_10352 [Tessaracoccus flavus]|nr:hypothetical protein SAMN05428934_10352 [Tessaracoccus flavus]
MSGAPTTAGTYAVTVTVTDAEGNDASVSFAITVEAADTTPTPPVAEKFQRTIPHTTPGAHTHNGRQGMTTCEPYSRTERCRTEIWASVVKRTGSTFTIERGWAFNNLTYLPFMKREQWAGNPLGYTGYFTGTDQAKWRTECDTEATGSNGCRSYRLTTVYVASPKASGGYTFGQENKWVFNNIVLFGNYTR